MEKKVVKPIAVSAPEYLSYLMSWVQGIIDDENIFPSQIEKPFPPDFQSIIRNIFGFMHMNTSSLFKTRIF
jgi:MOB kinase activator 1